MSDRPYPVGKLPHDQLAKLLETHTRSHPRLIVPPTLGEDAAVIDFGDRYLVAKTDPITFATDQIGWYAVHVNANDIAAMGAEPRFFLATVLLPENKATPSLTKSIFASIEAAATELGVVVCGGHTEITLGLDRPIVVGQMLGEVAPEALVRSSGLQVGDAVLLTKGMGIEATAIIAHEKEAELKQRGYSADFLDECAGFLNTPGISVVADARIACNSGGVTAMHDPTEGGVATGLWELATASQVGLEVASEALFAAPHTEVLCREFALDLTGCISSGALLVGCRPEARAPILKALAQAGITAAQVATAKPAAVGLHIHRDGQLMPLVPFTADEITRLFTD